MLVNKRQLSEILGRTERTLTAWSKQGMPVKISSARGRSNQYETADVITWMIQRELGNLSIDGLDLTAETARLKHHQANVEQLKEKQLRNDLIPAEIVILYGSGLVAAARAKFLGIHNKLKNRYTTLDQSVVDETQRLIHEALTELGDGVPPEISEKIWHVYARLDGVDLTHSG